MRGLARLAVPESAAASRTYATFSGGGRGRGRGSGLPPAAPPPRVPGQPDPGDADADDAFLSPAIGRGRGRGAEPHPPPLPSFPFLPPSGSGSGRGGPRHQPPPSGKQPVFFLRDEMTSLPSEEEMTPLPPSIAPSRPSGSGRGRGIPLKPGAEAETKPPQEVNRHVRPRPPMAARDPAQPRLSVEEAVKRAREGLLRGAPTARGRGRGGRTGMRGRGGRGRGRGADAAEELELYLGDNAAGENLEKRLGEANMNKLVEGFEELSWRVLPSPTEDAYLDALHTNNMVRAVG